MDQTQAIDLNPAQARVFEHDVLESGFSVVLQMPTGSGKTWLARHAVSTCLARGHRAIYLSPLRALADELASDWQQAFPEIPVGVFTGDYGRTGRGFPVPYTRARVLVMTPERLDACTRSWRSHWSWIPEVDWVIVDELHLLGEGRRGARLEGTISRIRRLNPFCRVLGLSATLGNRGELADWLEGVELASDWRAVPLEWRIERYRKPDEKPSLLAETVKRTLSEGGQSLVFVQSRRRCEFLARWLREQGIEADHHHAGLTHDGRRKVEREFRERSTGVLIATGTLEMGINLPARQVVLYDLQGFDGQEFVPLSVNSVWQRAGRAGRRGLDVCGEAVLLAPAWDRKVDRYLRGNFEAVNSQVTGPQCLAEQILAEVHSGLARTSGQLEQVFLSSLASHQGKTLKISRTVAEMLEAGMLREEEREQDCILKATSLGRIACRHQLSPATVLHLSRLLEFPSELTEFDLLLACATAPDCEPILTVDFEELENLSDELIRHQSTLLTDPSKQNLEVRGKRLLSALKTVIVLWRWTVIGDEECVAEEDGIYPFEIRRLIESFDRLLMAAGAIQKWLDRPHSSDELTEDESIAKSPTQVRIELLRQKVLSGMDGKAASLTLVDGIGASWARKLVGEGISDLASLAAKDPNELGSLPGLSKERAEKWIGQAAEVQLTVPPEVSAPRVPTFPPEIDMTLEPYRLRRSLDLKVSVRGRNRWTITGGSEPRQVELSGTTLSCSCPDQAKGRICKHILAVRRHLKDPEVCRWITISDFDSLPTNSYLDLFQLWFQR